MKQFIYSAFADEASPLFYEQLEAMQKSGITHLEMRGVNGRNVSAMTREEVRCAKYMLDQAGLKVWSIGSPVGKTKITDPFAPQLEGFKRLLNAAVTCEASVMRIFSFYGVKTDADKEEALSRLSQFTEAAKGSGILLCHENEKGIWGDTAENCLEILSAIPALGSVFDPANFIQCGVDPLTAWGMLADKTTYLHIKDATPDGKVVPAGHGVGNLPAIISDFGNRGGKVLSLEPHLTVFKGLADLEEDQKTDIDPFTYPDSQTAFAAAADALWKITKELI